jgi:hypothetical protein
MRKASRKMNEKEKGIIINSIIGELNESIKKENRKLCEQNLHSNQKAFHGFDMFMKLAFLSDSKILEIAARI